MLVYNPDKRIKAFDALQDPYFKNIREDAKELNFDLLSFTKGNYLI